MTIKQAITRLERLGIDYGYDTSLAAMNETEEGFFFQWDLDFDAVDIPDGNGYVTAIVFVDGSSDPEYGPTLKLIK